MQKSILRSAFIVGIGLAYSKGYFDQTLDENGWQQEHYFYSNDTFLPVELVKNEYGQPIRITVSTETYQIWVGIWHVHVGRNLLLLLDTNVEGNSNEDRNLTSTLYGGDRRARLLQELILGVGGIHALSVLGITPSVIHLNEGHTVFACLEFVRRLMERDGQTFENMREIASLQTVFTTHTPVEAGNDVFEPEMVISALTPLRRQLGISEKQLLGLGRIDPEDKREPFSMTVLGMKMSQHRNTVSFLNARVINQCLRNKNPCLGIHCILCCEL